MVSSSALTENASHVQITICNAPPATAPNAKAAMLDIFSTDLGVRHARFIMPSVKSAPTHHVRCVTLPTYQVRKGLVYSVRIMAQGVHHVQVPGVWNAPQGPTQMA